MISAPVYLDYAATTPVDPEVVAVMSEALTSLTLFANPSAKTHRYGWQAEQAIEHARSDLAEAIGAKPNDVLWTSGATEANNLAIQGMLRTAHTNWPDQPHHLITSAVEHKAVLDVCLACADLFADTSVTVLAPDAQGQVSAQQVQAALTPNTRLVSIMQVNNELGSVNPISEIAAAMQQHPAFLHVDATQSLGKLRIDFAMDGADLISLSAHKAYGPKGVGALVVNDHARRMLSPVWYGGRQELGLRPGSLATHQIIGFARAAQLAAQRLTQDVQHIRKLQQAFCQGALNVPGVIWHAQQAKERVPHIVNIGFADVPGEALLLALTDMAVASGAACNSLTVQPSHVLTACGVNATLAASSLRFSFGRMTRLADIERVVTQLQTVVKKLQS